MIRDQIPIIHQIMMLDKTLATIMGITIIATEAIMVLEFRLEKSLLTLRITIIMMSRAKLVAR